VKVPASPIYGPCPICGRRVAFRRPSFIPYYHYNRLNPPVKWAWEPCPGPTPEQLERARRMAGR
jgi:hypothetical protein